MDTITGNKLIADFMQVDELVKYGFNDKGDSYLNYEKSWNALMPVVEKIESLNFTFDIYTNGIKIISNEYGNLDGFTHGDIGTKIENVWNGIIKWLQWYNKEQGVEVSDTTEAK